MPDPIYCSPLELICQPLAWWSSAASWAQAVLSAGAIYAAYLIAAHQRKVEIADRRATEAQVARSFALSVLPVMRAFHRTLLSAHRSTPTDPVGRKMRSVEPAEVPDELLARVPQMHLLGAASDSVLGSIYQLQMARENLRSPSSIWTEDLPLYAQHMEAAANLAETAVLRLNLLLE